VHGQTQTVFRRLCRCEEHTLRGGDDLIRSELILRLVWRGFAVETVLISLG